MTEEFVVTVRDASCVEVGTLTGYTSLDILQHHMSPDGDSGLGAVTVPTGHRDLDLVLEPLADGEPVGIVVRRTGSNKVVASGHVVPTTVDDAPAGTTTIAFEPDDAILANEVPFCSPGNDVSNSSTSTWPQAYDTRTGPGETVLLDYVRANIGSTASIVRRRYPWLTVPASQGRGAGGTWQARPPQTLMDLCRSIAVQSGIAFRLAQAATGGAVAVEVWVPTALPDVRFSPEAGTVTGLVTTLTPRSVDEVIVMAGDEGASRLLTRRTAAGYTPGRMRRVRVIDQRQTSDLTQMQQAADEELADGAATAAAEFTLIERDEAPIFGVDYRLGDTISVSTWRRVTVQAPVMSVQIRHDAGSAPVVTPSIGRPKASPDASQLPLVRRLITPLLRS